MEDPIGTDSASRVIRDDGSVENILNNNNNMKIRARKHLRCQGWTRKMDSAEECG